jgi:N-acetyl-anhydromuramyl-L-alanine amidase AmpD
MSRLLVVAAALLLLCGLQSARAFSLVAAPSPNYTPSRGRHIDTVVLHYSSAINVDPEHWTDPRAVMRIFRDYRVSAHYLIDRAGTVYRLVDEDDVAWHAGGSIMPAPDNRRNVNRFSIGIEIIGLPTRAFTDAQYDSLNALLAGIRSRHPIRHVVGHDQIAGPRAVGLGLRRDVKPDPGPSFAWGRVE